MIGVRSLARTGVALYITIGCALSGFASGQTIGGRRCEAADLSVESLSAGIAAGTYGINYVLRNHGKTGCTLSGFPILSALDKHGKVIRVVKFEHISGTWVTDVQTPNSVNVASGSDAWFQIIYSGGGGLDDRSSCHQVTSLRIYWPGSKKPLVDHASFETCGPVSVTSLRPPPYD
jgi:hypothetical protein